jgi:hypothetical protein
MNTPRIIYWIATDLNGNRVKGQPITFELDRFLDLNLKLIEVDPTTASPVWLHNGQTLSLGCIVKFESGKVGTFGYCPDWKAFTLVCNGEKFLFNFWQYKDFVVYLP